MKSVKQEIAEIAALELTYGLKKKYRFSFRYYKKHPNKIQARRNRILKALHYEPPRQGIVGFN